MKILYVITGLGVGGAENLLVDVCGAIKEKHTVTVVYFSPDKTEFKQQVTDMGIEIKLIKSTGLNIMIPLFKLIRLFRKYDVIHTHLPRADFMCRFGMILSFSKKRFFTTVHNTDRWRKAETFTTKILTCIDRLTINKFRNITLIAVSESVKRYCVECEGILPEKIRVIPNFVDIGNKYKKLGNFNVQRFRKDYKNIMIVVGRLEEQKGHIYLLKAIKELCHDRGYEDIHLYVLGQGSLEKKMKIFVEENKIGRHITFLGFRRNVYDFVSGSDLFILPSLFEGFGLCTLESFNCGTPVLVSDIDVNRELTNGGKCGILFRVGDSSDLADKIQEFFDNKVDKGAYIKNGFERAKSFSIDYHIEQLEKIYAEGLL